MQEPSIIINGMPLTQGQAMAVRVAVDMFMMDLSSNGLGDDEHGKAMTEGYLKRLREVSKIMRA